MDSSFFLGTLYKKLGRVIFGKIIPEYNLLN
jgi:hypothetical protein